MSEGAHHGRVRVEVSPKRVRAYLGGKPVADTTAALLVWEVPYYPTYYFPLNSVRAELVPTGATSHSPSRGEGEVYDVRVPRKTAKGAALRYPASPIAELTEAVRFDWDLMDEWLEEDEPVYTHPRDPHKRVDILSSSRHVQVVIDGTTVADSHQPRALFETGLPTRWYVPMTDVRLDLLVASETQSHCPYKGTASYWSVALDGQPLADLAWGYRAPLPESQKIAGLVCFYNEKVDLYLDGVLQQRPSTLFS